MQLIAEDLESLISRRKFQQVIDAYQAGRTSENPASLFQVALAYSLSDQPDAAKTIGARLPREMQHDLRRDALLADIRDATKTVTWNTPIAPLRRLLEEAMGDPNRIAVAHMAMARAERKRDHMCQARQSIQEALLTAVGRGNNRTYQRNIAFWYLVIGARDMRQLAYALTLDDPSFSRRCIATLCYIIPFAGKLPPLSHMY